MTSTPPAEAPYDRSGDGPNRREVERLRTS